MDYKARSAELVAKMTTEEKASLCSGLSNWQLKSIDRLGLRGGYLTDGPHGLRFQAEGMPMGVSVPATCFPAACASACSFDRGLLFEIGAAIGDECRQEGVSLLLGPGVNIKRSPLCGRNFEYFSEDPMLAGEMGAAFVKGVQSRGVGVSVKHYAGNNQETRRLIVDSVMDERTKREIYLTAFERVVKQARPWTVMCAYNKLDGEYCSQNEALLTGVLRDEWGFGGVVVSDWGAVSDRVKALKAGLDLEMPGGDTWNDGEIVRAVKEGRLGEETLDKAARRLVELMLKMNELSAYEYDADVHHALARRAAIASSVLLKNDGLLPSSIFKNAALIGAAAKSPRYQGGGSSHMTPTQLDNAVREFTKAGLRFDYAEGYAPDALEPDEALISEACRVARGKDIVYIFAALPEKMESEGFDRRGIEMPRAQTELIRRVSEVNRNIAVILSCGGVVDMSWEKYARAILLTYLGGQATASATVEILLGRVNPCGKLAETWPVSLDELPASRYFPGEGRTSEYREGLYIGYRWFDSAGRTPRYPFGYGLSYTTFRLADLYLSDTHAADDGEITVGCKVTNTGTMPGAEIVQLYVAPPEGKAFRPAQELKGFEKVRLNPGESKTVWFKLGGRDFAHYEPESGRWCVESGDYEVRVGVSSRDIRLRASVKVESASAVFAVDRRAELPDYYAPEKGLEVSDAEFASLLGREAPHYGVRPYTVDSTLSEALECEAGRAALGRYLEPGEGEDDQLRRMFAAMLPDMPLRSLNMFGDPQLSRGNLAELVEKLNASK